MKLIKNKWFWIALLIPLIITIFLSYLIFGSPYVAYEKMYSLKGKPNQTADAFASLSDILTLLITTYGILITALFSYLVYTVSKQGVDISNSIKNLEENRDVEILREQALIIYHELQRNIVHLRDLYLDGLNSSEIKVLLRQFYFSDDWIRNVAKLHKGLSNKQLEQLYGLYNDFNVLKRLLESDVSHQEIMQHVHSLSEKTFIEAIPLPLLKSVRDVAAEDLVNIDLYYVLYKVYRMSYLPSQITRVNEDTGHKLYLEGILHESVTTVNGEQKVSFYSSVGKEKAVGTIINKMLILDKIKGYSKEKDFLYEITYPNQKNRSEHKIIMCNPYLPIPLSSNQTEDNQYFLKGLSRDRNIYNGITTLFDEKCNIIFRGFVKNGMKVSGIDYDPSTKFPIFEGTYEDENTKSGKIFYNNEVIFHGLVKDDKPWDGDATNLSDSRLSVLHFTGQIKEGKIFSGHGYYYWMDERGHTLEYYNELADYYAEREADESFWEFQDEHSSYNKMVRDNSENWEEYLAAEWHQGNPIYQNDIESNKIVVPR